MNVPRLPVSLSSSPSVLPLSSSRLLLAGVVVSTLRQGCSRVVVLIVVVVVSTLHQGSRSHRRMCSYAVEVAAEVGNSLVGSLGAVADALFSLVI